MEKFKPESGVGAEDTKSMERPITTKVMEEELKKEGLRPATIEELKKPAEKAENNIIKLKDKLTAEEIEKINEILERKGYRATIEKMGRELYRIPITTKVMEEELKKEGLRPVKEK